MSSVGVRTCLMAMTVSGSDEPSWANLVEHDLVRKPVSIPDQVRDKPFGIMLYCSPETRRENKMSPRLKHFGWGREGEGLTAEEEAFVLSRAEARFGTALTESATAPRLDDINLNAPRDSAPGSLPFCTSEHYDRAAHTFGKSYPELVRGVARDYANAPDVVAYPRDEHEVAAVLDWAGSTDATVTPFGGGSSVCGGGEPHRGTHKGAVTIDLREMGKVKEVDRHCA